MNLLKKILTIIIFAILVITISTLCGMALAGVIDILAPAFETFDHWCSTGDFQWMSRSESHDRVIVVIYRQFGGLGFLMGCAILFGIYIQALLSKFHAK